MKFSSHTKRLILATLILMALIIVSTAAPASDRGPLPALKPLSDDGQMTLSPADRCPVCAMFPARRPHSAAAIKLNSGETFYFCSNGCLLRTWLRPTVYLRNPKDAISRLVVLDYFSGQPIDGRTATWVAGSDVVGPMGPAIVALGDPGEQVTFKSRHGGTIVFSFDQLDDALWKKIGGHELPAEKKE